jgi:hypothetical protein
MGKIKIESTSESKRMQKSGYFNSSSTVFLVNHNPSKGIETEISMLNHFILKRNIRDVEARIFLRKLSGELISSQIIKLAEPKTYTFNPCENIETPFIGSVYIEFSSKENLAVPFCAVVESIKAESSVCAVHTYGRRLEVVEIGSKIDITNTKETGWTLRDSEEISSFAAFHNGAQNSQMSFTIEIQNHLGHIISHKSIQQVSSYETIILTPKNIFNDLVDFLDNNLGQAKVIISGLKGVFPRMICGNFFDNLCTSPNLNNANEIQFTHTNFDFSELEQPDSISSIGYFNQPYMPSGYGIFYPVKTSKNIKVNNRPYLSNELLKFNIDSFSQILVESINSKLPSRFVGASVGKWINRKVESECSTGTFTEDYLANACHWHWGLLKPCFDEGKSIISIILNKFNEEIKICRNLTLRLFDDNGLSFNKIINLNKNIIIDDLDLSGCSGSVWFVLSGERLEDLNIYSTFIPTHKSGFCEHAF